MLMHLQLIYDFQAEHGPDSQVVLVISGEGVDLNVIEEELNKQCQSLPRGEFAANALSHSFIVYAHDMLEVSTVVQVHLCILGPTKSRVKSKEEKKTICSEALTDC